MTELGEIFAELGISQYLNDFIEQGFDTWETILDIKETDFDALNVKLGHRRKLQRKIASARGLSSDRALGSPSYTGPDGAEESKPGSVRGDAKEAAVGGGTQGAKRKYRRHPKADENAPERPPSAYVIFSNKMREDLKGRNLSFTEIAKLVGEHWQNLVPRDKEPFETQASNAKERYLGELTRYKKTDQYREYMQYLAEFKARQQNQQPVNDLDPAKRPRLEAQPSTNSTGTISSGTSGHGVDTPPSSRETPAIPTPLLVKDRRRSPQPSSSSTPASGSGASRVLEPSVMTSPVLPGYRESLYVSTYPTLPWRDASRDESIPLVQPPPRIRTAERLANTQNALSQESGHPNPAFPAHISPPQHPPALMKSESTNSTVSSTYYNPHTPLELPPDRGVSLPPIFSQKPIGAFDTQLPPLRPPSLSPQTSVFASSHSPNGSHKPAEHPTWGGSRNYPQQQSAQAHQGEARPALGSQTSSDEALDPVTALLRAGEIVNRSSRQLP